jgi:signal transduction histidine kinase/DNA-binding NarL/FixJ family response regulator/tetratricopeptide (TPR) repeat protein
LFTEHKFICFCLDDLHFADEESLELISQIIGARLKMVIVITYRPEESDRVQRVLNPPESEKTPGFGEPIVTEIKLAPLNDEDISEYVALTLRRPREEIAPLALVIQSKTAGNPFYMREMLSACYRKKCIEYDYDNSQWSYDLDKLFEQFQGVTDYDVLDTDFITRRLNELPPASRSILAWAALLGQTFSFDMVCKLMSGEFHYDDEGCGDGNGHGAHYRKAYSQQDAVSGLHAAIQAYIIVPSDVDDRFRFAHDRYVQAAAALKECSPRKMHFVIAQTLLKYYSSETKWKESTASHICEAVDIIKRKVRHREPFRKLLCECAQASTESGARATAAKYYGNAVALLQANPWDDGAEDVSYVETMQLYLRAAECYLYMGRLSAASDVLQTIFTSSETVADRAEAWVLESRIHAQGGNSVRALECLKECLKALDVHYSENPTMEQCDAEFTKLAERIEALDMPALLSPPGSDTNSLSGVGSVLAETVSAGFWSDGLQFYHLSLVMMDLHLTRGAFPQSGMAFMHMALIALTRFNKAAFSMHMGEIALQLIDKYRDPYCLARGYMIFANWVGHLQYKISHMVSRLEGVVEAASGAEDRISTIVSIGLAAQLKLFASENCADLEAFCLYECEDIPDWHKDTRGGTILIAVRQTCRALQGKTRASDPLCVLSDDQHDSAKYKLWLKEATNNGGRSLLFYETLEMVPLFLYGHYEQAIKVGQACYQNWDAMWSCRNTRLSMLFYGLSLAGTVLRQQHNPRVLGEALPSQVEETVRQVSEVNDNIKSWQALSDINYRAWTLLLDAQVAEMLGDTDTAMRLYEMAVDHAEEQNFVFEAALGHYLLANIFIRASTRRSARYMLQEAVTKFRQFGAVGIADRIEADHSLLLHNPTGSQRYIHTAVQTDFSGDPPSVQYRNVDAEDAGDGEPSARDMSGRADDADLAGDRIGAWRGSTIQPGAGVGLPALDMIDLSAILTCSQRISSVLRVDELLKTMCDVILQTCGGSASLAAIVVQDEGSSDWCVAASGDPERGAEAHLPGIPLSDTYLVAENVVLYCTRFREVVFLRDLLLDERFGNVGEQWLQRNPHSKAIIAIPIFRGEGQPLLGVVYLEGAAGSFTDRNVEVLQLLVDQIGISYSNALAMKAVEKVSAEKAAMVDMQKQALAAAREAEKKAKDAEAEAKRNVKLAEEAAKAKSIFLANVSHELRTPLNGVIGNSELLRDSNLNKDQLEMADSIRVSADLLLTVINDILDFSRMEADKMKLYIIAFNPEEMVREVVRAVSYSNREKASKKNVKIIQDINLPPMLIFGDPIRLHQVLGNLIGNSLKFTEHGSITIGARVESETDDHATLTFWVKDTGIGISQQQMKKLFLPFSQADASTARKYGGSGLGLSICKSLIETMMKGKIELESKEQQGTRAWFTVTFEKAPSEVVAGDAQGAVRGQPAQRQRSMSVSEVPNYTPYGDLAHVPKDQLRISIAEDNEINAKIALTYLKRLGYNHIDTYDNGQKAVEGLRKKALEGSPYHVVLMDVQMPVLDGYEATKLLRNDSIESVRKILVIAMTASAIQGDREKCLAAGMNDYLAKPVKQDVLKRKLETYLSVQVPSNGDNHKAPTSATTKLLNTATQQPAQPPSHPRSVSVSSPLSRQIDVNGSDPAPVPNRPVDAPSYKRSNAISSESKDSDNITKSAEVVGSPSTKRQPEKSTKTRRGSDVSVTEKHNTSGVAAKKSAENIPPGS